MLYEKCVGKAHASDNGLLLFLFYKHTPMNRIKCLLAAAVLCGALISCQQTKTPKSVATEFVQQLYGLDFTAAGSLAANGQDLIQGAKADLERRVSIDEERARRSKGTADETFQTAAFTERANGDEVSVQNNQLAITVRKEEGNWKVVPTAELVDALVNHPIYLDEAKLAWERLRQEYEKRDNLAQEYITMRVNRGEKSDAIMALDRAVLNSKSGKTATAAERADYVARHDKLETLMDKGIEPAQNAAADFSLNYIVQLSDSRKRIEEARKAYDAAARKAHDTNYPVLP
jgi:hypothetical protein